MILNEFLPDADFREHHSLLVPLPPDRVGEALREVRLSEMSWIVAFLLALRGLPALLVGNADRKVSPRERPLLLTMVDDGFVRLAEAPDEIVLGWVGAPWRLNPTRLVLGSPEAFLTFHGAQWAKIAFNLSWHEVEGGTLLSTETRVRVADPRSRKLFARYWFVIRHGSGLIRVLWLRAIARKARTLRPPPELDKGAPRANRSAATAGGDERGRLTAS